MQDGNAFLVAGSGVFQTYGPHTIAATVQFETVDSDIVGAFQVETGGSAPDVRRLLPQ